MELYDEFFKITGAFNKARVKYALIGGIAMGYYSEPRYTKDIDFLTLQSEIMTIQSVLEKLDYEESAQPWTFIKTKITLRRFAKIEKSNVVSVDILIGEEPFHKKIITSAIKLVSKTGNVKIVKKEDLIKLKSIRNSDQDKVDIKKLGMK
jgi:predicted nucleotidyltransferase